MNAASSRITQARLDQALADIREHISNPEDWQAALRQLSSIKDYAMGEERFCTAQAALENCEQIKGYFSAGAPASALQNLDAIADEIQSLQKQDLPVLVQLLANPLTLIAAGVAIYWFFFR